MWKMSQLLGMESPMLVLMAILGIVLLRYLLIAGGAYLVMYHLCRKKLSVRKIQGKYPSEEDIKRELSLSFSTVLIYTLVIWLLFFTPVKNWTQIVDSDESIGAMSFMIKLLLMLGIHDLYFYLTHRLLHHPKLYSRFHLAHHRSSNPTPLASLAFHPVEAFVQIGIVILLVFIMPVSFESIVLFGLINFLHNVYGHSGYEILPRRLLASVHARWFCNSTFHNLHHEKYTNNFGLYSRIWDSALGTTHAEDSQKRARFY